MFVPLDVNFLKYKTAVRSDCVAEDATSDGIGEIIDKMFPAKIWVENGYLWTQRVSTTPVTRIDVLNLQQRLNDALHTYKARETGICPIRRELYDKCLQEIIREVTVSCAEQGLLLYRIRNETLMTLKAYETVYESLVAFNSRKAFALKNELTTIEEKLASLNEENISLKNQLIIAEQKHETCQAEFASKLEMSTTLFEQKISDLNTIISKQKILLETLTRRNSSTDLESSETVE